MTTKWKTIALVVSTMLLSILLISACGGGNREDQAATGNVASGASPDVSLIDVLLSDSYYGDTDTNIENPPTWTVASGSDVLMNIKNQGELKHNWAIVQPDSVVPIPYEGGQLGDMFYYMAGMIYTNNQTTMTFIAPEDPGDYLVICTVSGHYPFMQGRLIVE